MLGGGAAKKAASRFNELVSELLKSPFFPLLFIGEFCKTLSTSLLANQPSNDVVVVHFLMAVGSIVIWVYFYDLKEVAEDVAEGSE